MKRHCPNCGRFMKMVRLLRLARRQPTEGAHYWVCLPCNYIRRWVMGDVKEWFG